jgi:hypothetical protein
MRGSIEDDTYSENELYEGQSRSKSPCPYSFRRHDAAQIEHRAARTSPAARLDAV